MTDYLNLPKADYSSNLVAKWVFDNTNTSYVNGTTIYDLSGNRNDLTSYNVTYVDDTDLGRCAYFNGSSSYMLGSSPILPIGEKSILIKFKLSPNTTNGMRIISTCTWRDNGTILQHNYADQTIWFYERENNSYAVGSAHSSCVCVDNNPYIMLFTNGNSLNNKGKIFQENLSTDIGIVTESTVLKTSAHSHNLVIGKQLKNSTEFLKGYIQSIEIYDKAIEYSDNAFFIKDSDKIYSFKDEEYISPSYNEINDVLSKEVFYNKGQWDINKLITETTIDSETFKPIEKFSAPQVISYIDKDIKMLGRKSDKQLVVASSSFSTKIAENIDYFKATFNVNNNSYIKMAISIDEGQTWKTTSDNGTTWTDLTCTIPLKEYSTLTADELIEWNNALTEIDNNGFNIADIENIDFNTIKDETIMFAYVLYQDTYDSICDNLSLDWKFNSVGRMKKMTDSEVGIEILGDTVIVTPTIDNDMIKVNILNGVPEGGSSSDFGIDNIIAGDNIEIEKDDVNNTVTINANVDVSSISGSSSLDLNSLPYFGI